MRQQKFDEARKLAEGLARNASEPRIRTQAESLLKRIVEITEQLARFQAKAAETDNREVIPRDDPQDGARTPPRLMRRRFDGEKVRGMLTEMACSANSMTIIVKAADRVFKFHTTSPERLQFLTYTPDVSAAIECGKVNPAQPVLVTYRASTDAKSRFDGEPIAVEFEKGEEK
jgi:hypothetical protein